MKHIKKCCVGSDLNQPSLLWSVGRVYRNTRWNLTDSAQSLNQYHNILIGLLILIKIF